MSIQSTAAPRELVVKYAIYLITGVFFFWAVDVLASLFIEMTFRGSPVGMLIIFCSAMFTGIAWYNAGKVSPPSRKLWEMTLYCTGMTFVLQGLLVGVLCVLFPVEAGEFFNLLIEKSALFFLGLLLAMFIVVAGLIRLGLAWGVRQAIKKAESPSR